jgi:transcriptional regulator with XRE-family HTH domain
MSNIGENVKAARLKANLTQSQLATDVRVTRNYIAQIESGRRKPAIELLVKISKATEVGVSELLKGDKFLEALRLKFFEEAQELLHQQ